MTLRLVSPPAEDSSLLPEETPYLMTQAQERVFMRPLNWWSSQILSLMDFLVHVRRRWYLYVPLAAIWALAYVRMFFDPTPHIPLLFNWTPSVPYHVALMQYGPRPLHRGDLIVFSFEGEARSHYPGLNRQPFFKLVRGLPGDVVTVQGAQVLVNGQVVGQAKPRAFDRYPLTPISPVVIPADHYYVQGTSPDSFDSRYQESGLVHVKQVLGVARPLF